MKKIIKKIIRNIKFMLLKLNNMIVVLTHKQNFNKSVAIVSCNKWVLKVKEDWLLKNALNKLNVNVDIISWEDESLDYKKYDALIIRSIWGYQDNSIKFNNWLDSLLKNNIKVFNDVSIVKNNLNKYEQFKLLKKYNIPCINTEFIFKKDIKDSLSNTINSLLETNFNKKDLIVIKPVISGSGNNTYIIDSKKNHNNSIMLSEVDSLFNNDILTNGLMIQKFMPEIINGEYSLIYIDSSLSHVMLRFPAIFSSVYHVDEIVLKSLDSEVLSLGNSIKEIKEYKNSLYMRVDILKTNEGTKIMEVELLDPDLLYNYIKDSKMRQKAMNLFANSIVKRLNK
ncbi:MAG: hypothetical protein RSE17_02760 [Bacilli bacterium]